MKNNMKMLQSTITSFGSMRSMPYVNKRFMSFDTHKCLAQNLLDGFNRCLPTSNLVPLCLENVCTFDTTLMQPLSIDQDTKLCSERNKLAFRKDRGFLTITHGVPDFSHSEALFLGENKSVIQLETEAALHHLMHHNLMQLSQYNQIDIQVSFLRYDNIYNFFELRAHQDLATVAWLRPLFQSDNMDLLFHCYDAIPKPRARGKLLSTTQNPGAIMILNPFMWHGVGIHVSDETKASRVLLNIGIYGGICKETGAYKPLYLDWLEALSSMEALAEDSLYKLEQLKTFESFYNSSRLPAL